MRDLNRKMARGAFWMALVRVAIRSLSLVSTVILARLLVPADFGLVAMATSIVAFLQLLTAFSFDIPLIQKQDASRRHFDTAWTLNVGFYSILTVLLIALAGPAASFYQEERLTDVVYLLAAGFFVKGFENIGVVHFRKNLDFKKDFMLLFSKKLIGFVITIPLAFYFRSYWVLVVGIVASNIGGVALTYALHPFRPKFSISEASEMLHFSKWLVCNNAINFLRTRSPDFVIGRMSGSAALGVFTVAYEIATLPTSELVAPINRVVFPGYSQLSKNMALLGESYLNVLAVIAFIALPAGFGISAVATPLVDVVLGEKWSEAAPIVSALAIFGALNALLTNNGSIYNAVGKPYMITILGGANTIILVAAAIVLATTYGAIGVAFAFLGTTALFGPISLYMIGRELQLGATSFLRVLWRPAFCTALMYLGVLYFRAHLSATMDLNAVQTLLLLVLTGALLYVSASLALWVMSGKPQTIDARLVGVLKSRLRWRARSEAPTL